MTNDRSESFSQCFVRWVALPAIIGLTQSSSTAYAVFPDNFAYRQKITIDATKVSPTDATNLSNFPVLIKLTDVNLKDSVNSGHVVQADGGDIELLKVDDDGVVTVRLHGACVGCPSSAMTLSMGIERNLREQIPEITRVVCD